MKELSDDAKDRFYSMVKHDPTGCWLWFGYRMKNGYGTFCRGILFRGTRSILAHRASWMIYNGKIPDGKCVLHKCDVRWCVNPEHLWIGTHEDNMRDMFEKGRNPDYRGLHVGELAGMAKLTWEQVGKIRSMIANRVPGNAIARQFKISRSVVSGIRANAIWKDDGWTVPQKFMKKLTDDDASEIRKLYATGKYSQNEIGRMFGVAQTRVSQIVLGQFHYFRKTI